MLTQTPVESHGGILVKRDDLYRYAGAPGGKARTCAAIAADATNGLVTAGSRSSPQVNIVARIGAHLGLPVRVHTPAGEPGPEVVQAVEFGAERVVHNPGYNTVIVARARDDATARGWTLVPFGMETPVAVAQTAGQVTTLPPEVRRIVVPVGSGMSLCGILEGLLVTDQTHIEVLGVVVGADPTRRLDRYAPPLWSLMATLEPAGMPYDTPAGITHLGDLDLDEIYEAKCLPFLRPGDLLWVVGIRPTRSADRVGCTADGARPRT